ncbi:MAG: sigma 54-interacting transcriptional regulator [Myxococcales bacterium]|nr:sigma 54-interacting transcriptional regulator [Myxococcales bacterium]
MATSNSVRPTGTPAPLCVGRERELEQLTRLHGEAPEHGERLVLVEGSPGSGKTRLLHELARRTRLDGGVVLEGRCDPGRAFGPFATIVDRALRFLADMSMEPSIELRDLGCSDGCHRFWHQHALDDAPAGGTRDARERRLRFFDAVRGLLRDVARVRPPLVVLHDLERADAATLQLLRYVFDGAGPWNDGVGVERTLRALFVATVAEGCARDDVHALREGASTTRLSLAPLDAAGVRAYLQSEDAVRRVLDRTNGIPERIDLLLQADPLPPEDATARVLGAMPAGTRALVEGLSVLAQPTDLDALRGLVELAVSPAERQVFADHELIQRTVLDGRLLFTFARETQRALVYAALDPARRRDLHRRCAHFLATRGGGDQAAHHALAAGDLAMAVPLALADARTLAARHAHSEGAALLERVLAEGPSPEDAVALHEALAELYRVVGDYARGRDHAEHVRMARPDDAEAAHQVGRLLTLAGRLDEAARELRVAHGLASADETRVAVEAALAELEYQRGAYDEAGRWAETALTSHPSPALEVQARNTLGKVALARKEAAAAAELFERNQARAHEASLGNLEAQALTNLGVARLRQHRLGDAERCFTRSLAIAADVNDSRERAIATENLAVLAHLRRDFAVALDHYERGVALLKRLGNRTMLARIGINMGELYHSIGDFARARSLAEFAQHMGGATLPDYFLAEIVLLRGRIELAEGRLGLARGYLESALETYDRLGAVKGILPRLALIRVALDEGAIDRARALLEGAPELDTPPAAAELALLEAELARAEGRDDVLELASRAERVIRDTGDPELHLEGLVVLARAQLDAGQLVAGQKALVEARQIEASLEAKVPDLSRVGWSTRPMRQRLEAAEDQLARARFGRARSSSAPPPARRRSAELDRRYPDIVGSSSRTTQLLEVLDKVAPSDATVLVRGESGTGKELVAEALHQGSSRRERPLVKVNCAALVETLLMSELFGHERGAFTGATARKKGRFELADGGTLFLDEIGDISPKMQVALLRVLQEREFERVGGTSPIKVDVRIIAATHRNLEEMVAEGSFREDLYYRLRGVTLEVSPLRERLDDLPELVGSLLGRIAEERGEPAKHPSPEVLAMLARHRWPGNVRELQNVLRSATLFAEGDILRLSDFATFSELPQNPAPVLDNERLDVASLEEAIYARVREGEASLFELKKVIERECISRALTETSGNITKAADLLGMKRPRLSQLVKQYGLGDSTRVG